MDNEILQKQIDELKIKIDQLEEGNKNGVDYSNYLAETLNKVINYIDSESKMTSDLKSKFIESIHKKNMVKNIKENEI